MTLLDLLDDLGFRFFSSPRSVSACAQGITTSPSLSPTTMSPGFTITPSKVIAWLILPGAALVVPLIEMPPQKTENP